MTDTTTGETPENRTDIDARLARIEASIRELHEIGRAHV